MTERQHHGLEWETWVKHQFNLGDHGYTSHWDGELDGKPLSIKCMGWGNSLEMASLARFWTAPPFTMIVGWWKTPTRRVVGWQRLEFTQSILDKLRGTLSQQDIDYAVSMLTVKQFPIGQHEQARQWFKQWKQENKDKMGLLTLTGKVDSKSQRRWQCSINSTNFYKLFGERQLNLLEDK